MVHSLSRLTRNVDDIRSINKLYDRFRIKLSAFDCPMADIWSIEGKNILVDFTNRNEYQREIISKNVKIVMRTMSEESKLIGQPPYGWRLQIKGDKNELIEHES